MEALLSLRILCVVLADGLLLSKKKKKTKAKTLDQFVCGSKASELLATASRLLQGR